MLRGVGDRPSWGSLRLPGGSISAKSARPNTVPPMSDVERRVIDALDELDADYETMACDPELADTAAFCEHYGVALEDSANAILVASKRPSGQLALCVVLAVDRLDVNKKVRDAMGVKKLSFAPPELTAQATGMMIGGVTPFGLPDVRSLVDTNVLKRSRVIVGGGSRSLKISLDPEVFTRAPGVTVIDITQGAAGG